MGESQGYLKIRNQASAPVRLKRVVSEECRGDDVAMFWYFETFRGRGSSEEGTMGDCRHNNQSSEKKGINVKRRA